VQIDITTVRLAQQDGLAFDRKDNGEVAVGVRPDLLMSYVSNAEALHTGGADAQTAALLATAAALPRLTADQEASLDQEIGGLSEPRQRIVQEVRRLARTRNFRQQVLHAYGNRCAVTRVQLRLVDAAHILPVEAPGSIDHVSNGFALAPTYHRAYDSCLIYLDEDYVMRINPVRADSLVAQGLGRGLPAIRDSLGTIYLPPDRRQWPNRGLIRQANRFRRIE